MGVEPGAPGSLSQGINWLPDLALLICAVEMWDHAALYNLRCSSSSCSIHGICSLCPAWDTSFAGSWSSSATCSQQGGKELPHILLSGGAHFPARRQLIRAAFLNLCLPPCSCQQTVPSIFMTPVFHKHQGFRNDTKAFFLWPMTTQKGPDTDPR